MRIVADTNVIVSAFLWGGLPRRLLDAVETQQLELFTSRALIIELQDALARAKYTRRRRFGELQPADIKRLRQLEIENAKLKKIVAERDLEIDTVSELAVEALIGPVLPGLAGVDVCGVDAFFGEPLENGVTDELRAVVRANAKHSR